jgi:hypothetical protein
MRYNEIINELFIQPAQWTQVRNDAHMKSYEFTIRDVKYETDIVHLVKSDSWGVAFDVDSGTDNDYKLTGTGNAAQVLTTVLDIMKAFVSEYQPEKLRFSAALDEPSRVSLYRRMVVKLNPAQYTTSEINNGFDIVFMMQRKTDIQEEVINELTGVKRFRDKTAKDILAYYRNKLGNGPVKLLGYGHHAAAIMIGQNVYKMWMQDSAYTDFVNYALKHQNNPFLPKFKSGIKQMPAFFKRHEDAPDVIQYIKMEYLTPVDKSYGFRLEMEGEEALAFGWLSLQNIIETLYSAFDYLNPDISSFLEALSEKSGYDYSSYDLGDQVTLLVETIMDIMAANPEAGHNLDLHFGNFMMRGDQLVILDPTGNSQDSSMNELYKEFDNEFSHTTGMGKPGAMSKYVQAKLDATEDDEENQ